MNDTGSPHLPSPCDEGANQGEGSGVRVERKGNDKLNRLRPALLQRARDFRRPLTPMEQRL